MSETKKLTFEEALKQLEEIVIHLENEDVPLEKAINYYEQGMKLSKLCDDMLQKAEEKMTQIIKDNEEIEPFDIQEE